MFVSILLSTFNGEKYIIPQIDSILNQSYDDFCLIIRDDGSTDSTVKIILKYKEMYPNKIKFIQDNHGNIGVAKSFELLMKETNSEFYLFCDQDDIWMENKMEQLLNQTLTWNKNIPHLCFSDMFFQFSSQPEQSFFKRFRINQKIINNGLYQGMVSGCIMLFNDACKIKNLQLNANSTQIHDWNIFITATIYGEINLLNEKLIKHRIHETNVVGIGSRDSIVILLKDLLKYLFINKSYNKIKLSSYYLYVSSIINQIDESKRLEKEMYTEKEVDLLSYCKRKKWYINHFNPFSFGIFEGIIRICLI